MNRRLTRLPARSACLLLAAIALAGCYPRYDWRDDRPDCAVGFCAFIASFPGKVTSARRDIPVGGSSLPLSLHVVSIGEVTFAVGAFELRDVSEAAQARATFERKLLNDVGAADARRGRITLYAADRTPIVADTFEADGTQGGKSFHVSARFAERRGHLVEIVVIGPADVLATGTGRQAIETFVTSLRLD